MTEQTTRVEQIEGTDLPAELRAAYDVLAAGAAQIAPPSGLADKLIVARQESRPLRVKFGIDPSGSDLTLGHAVVLRKVRQFQDEGHLAVLIVGDFTGMVGDPSGRSATRRQLTGEETAANSAAYFDQLMRILDPDRVEVRRNSEWLAGMSLADVVRELSVLTVAQLLERDDFGKRFAAHQPITLSEFIYPFLVGYDSVAVRADIEMGGTDQTYNLHVGRVFQKAHGQPEQAVITMPLLEGLDGVAKMSKSLGNYVTIDEPATEQFGKLMSIPDRVVARYGALAAALRPRDVAAVAERVQLGGAAANRAKRRVASTVVALYHGAAAAADAEEAFDARFRRHETPADVPAVELPAADPVHLPGLLVGAGLVKTTSAGRRALLEGSVRLDGERLDAEPLDRMRADLAGRVLSVGRRRAARLVDPRRTFDAP